MALVEPLRAERLGHQRVQAEQNSQPEDRERHEQAAADPDGADRLRSEAPHHQGVHHPHEHPAEFGKNDGGGKTQHGGELAAHAETAEGHPMIVVSDRAPPA
jgi:hypothetical protein